MGQLAGLIIVLGGVAIIGLIILLWMKTPSGKKWLASL